MRTLLLVALLGWPVSGFAQHAVAAVRVRMAPPALQAEIRTAAPSPGHQWIPGYWSWSRGRHIWAAGHWALPPAPSYVWQPAEWRNEGGVWLFYEGHWQPSAPVQASYVYQPPAPPVQPELVPVAPPAPLVEVRTAPPFVGALWIPGYWSWTGVRHVWVAGGWSARPDGYNWEREHWERLPNGKWKQRPGHWHHGHFRG